MTTEQREAKRTYNAAYDADHGEEIRAYKAAWYQDHREEQRVYNAAYRAAHSEEMLAYGAAHKEERRSYNAEYREANREEIRAQRADYYGSNRGAILETQAKESAEFREWLQVLRTVNGCEDCEIHEGRLLHHHVDPETRMYKVSEMYGCSIDTLEDELEKCVVLCHSCHMARHVEMRAA